MNTDLLASFLTDSESIEGLEYVNGEKSMETSKWLYNIIKLSLYYLCISRLEPTIRHHMRKQGISIIRIRNIYSGFYTEFKFNPLDLKSNSLISAQLALYLLNCMLKYLKILDMYFLP